MTGRTISYLRRNALAAAALFVALGGTSFAAAGGFSSSTGQVRACVREDGTLALLKGRRCRRGQKPLAWSVRGPQGAAGKPGSTGAPGTAGASGPQGAPGSALAYAHVTKAGGLDEAASKNVADARPGLLGEATTCVYGRFTPHNAVANVFYGLGEGTGGEHVGEISVDPKYTGSLCPGSPTGAPAVAMVIVRDEKGSPSAAGYYIAFN